MANEVEFEELEEISDGLGNCAKCGCALTEENIYPNSKKPYCKECAEKILASKNTDSYFKDQLLPGERVVLECEYSIARPLFKLFFGILFFWWFLIPLIRGIKAMIIWRNKKLTITNKRILCRYGVFDIVNSELSLVKATKLTVTQSFLGRIFNYGNLGSAEKGEGVWVGLKNPDQVKRAISNLTQGNKKLFRINV